MTVKELDDIIKDLDNIIKDLDNKRQRKRELQKAKAQAELSAIDREYEAYFDGIYDAIKAVKAIMPEPTKMEKKCDNCGNYGKIPKADDCGMCVQARLSNGVLTDPSHWKPKTQQPAEGE